MRPGSFRGRRYDEPQDHTHRRLCRHAGAGDACTGGWRHEPNLRLRLFPALSGDDIRLAAFTGRPLLVVNTASLCGYTPQYAGLQDIWSEFRERGLTVIGVPPTISLADRSPAAPVRSRKPPTTNTALPSPSRPRPSWSVQRRIHSTNGRQRRAREVPRWNFHKYLIGRDGYIADVFASAVEPTDTRIKTAIAKALADT